MAKGLRLSEGEFAGLRAGVRGWRQTHDPVKNKVKAQSEPGAKPAAKPRGEPEHDMQVRFFQWAQVQAKTVPDLDKLYAIPNGGHRHNAVAAKLRAEGVKKGIPDVKLPVPRGGFVGLAIEFKAGENVPSKEQREKITQLQRDGWCVTVCWCEEAAKRVVMGYLGMCRLQWEGSEPWA
ncbi:MAG TPA: VRR-NUC domain-containing protein [Limnobacter sp.]|nr:VRR-NUC domain-containing protein [Limnobacter sp.]